MSAQAATVAFIASILALAGVVMAAAGSHLFDLKAVDQGARIWDIASLLHLFEAATIIGLSAWLNASPSKTLLWACWALLLGTVIFCGSLYLRVASAGNLTGAAPAGGLIMMLGWLLAAWSFARSMTWAWWRKS